MTPKRRISIREVIRHKFEEFARRKGLQSVGDALVLILKTLKSIIFVLSTLLIVLSVVIILATILPHEKCGLVQDEYTPVDQGRAIETASLLLALALAALTYLAVVDYAIKRMGLEAADGSPP
jgi:F0F1-type ATP synthase membrane subunit a